MMDGRAKSDFSDVAVGLPDVKLDLDGGHGFEASAMFAFPVRNHRLAVGPFLRTWSMSRSDSFVIVNPDNPAEGIELFEPSNRTTELGFRLSFAF